MCVSERLVKFSECFLSVSAQRRISCFVGEVERRRNCEIFLFFVCEFLFVFTFLLQRASGDELSAIKALKSFAQVSVNKLPINLEINDSVRNNEALAVIAMVFIVELQTKFT